MKLESLIGPDILRPKPEVILTLDEIFRGVKNPFEVVYKSLENIKRENKVLNSYITIIEEEALNKASELEKKIKQGVKVGPLAGIPIAVKDNIFTKGVKTTIATKIFKELYPSFNATVIQRLHEADAVIIGKTNLHAFAAGATNTVSEFGPTKNPHDVTRITGGSSGGSAATVAFGSVPISLGSDTIGSVRIPAAFCGIVGYKPTNGIISRYGLFPTAWSLDTIGFFAKNVIDVAYALNVLSGKDYNDPSSIDFIKVDISAISKGIKYNKVVLGVLVTSEESYIERHFMDKIIPKLNSEGLNVRRISFDVRITNNITRMIRLAEGAAIHSELFKQKSEDYPKDVAELVKIGLSIPAYEYINSLIRRREVTNEFLRIFSEIDVIITPTVASIAPKINDVIGRELEYRDILTHYVAFINMLGAPAISIPAGKIDNMPIGVQIIGKPLDDENVLRIARGLEVLLS